MWSDGYRGRGIGIALIDTSVVPVEGLSPPGKIINGPDLSFDSQMDNLRHLDGYGHGTHMAGIIVGATATCRRAARTTPSTSASRLTRIA